MFFIRNKIIFLSISSLLIVLSIAAIAIFGLRFGIDFTGGTLLEVAYPADRPQMEEIEERLSALDIGTFSLRPIDTNGYLLRSRELDEGMRARVEDALAMGGGVEMEVVRLNTVGPVVGAELRNKSYAAISIVLVMIILYIAFAFRSVSVGRVEEEIAPLMTRQERRKNRREQAEPRVALKRPVIGVSSWHYGIAAVIALFHDIIIMVGVFAVLGQFMGVEIDILFVMALLAILGYSVNDTIVVFDRVRENLRLNAEREVEESFEDLVGHSLEQTYARSINTSLTTLLVLLALLFLGGASTTYFILALTIGVVAGVFSSIAFASPLLLLFEAHLTGKKENA